MFGPENDPLICNRPLSIYQYSNMAPRHSGQTSIFDGDFFQGLKEKGKPALSKT